MHAVREPGQTVMILLSSLTAMTVRQASIATVERLFLMESVSLAPFAQVNL